MRRTHVLSQHVSGITHWLRLRRNLFFYKSWLKAGVENVKDLLDEASRFISFDVFVRKFKVKTNYLEYYKVVSTLTRYKKLCSPITGNDQIQDATKTLLSHTKFCKKSLSVPHWKERLQHHLKAKVNGWLRTQYETRRLIGKAHIHYHFGLLKKQNWESFSLNFYINESQPMIFYTK